MAQRRHTGRRSAAAVSAAQLALLAQLKTGTIVGGNFRIISTIGEGGMGIVYSAEHVGMKRQCALKVLACDIDENWSRFQAEAKLLSKLKHPTLVQVHDLGIHQMNLPYYAMDYLTGSTLEEMLCSKGPLSLTYVIDVFLLVLDGLAYAHDNNVVHRDIKPANIFICSSDKLDVKILDFGISKLTIGHQDLTKVGEIFGSPYYMSPEQCRGERVDARSDIYSVGCSLFESLTGYVPYEGAAMDMVRLHEQGQVPSVNDLLAATDRPLLPASIEIVIANCLAKLPEQRYQSAQELREDLLRLRSGQMIAPLKTEKESSPNMATIIALTGLLLVASIAVLLYQSGWFNDRSGKSGYEHHSSTANPKIMPTDRMVTSLYSEPPLPTFDAAKVRDYLATHTHPYCKNDSDREFEFPRAFSLGELVVGAPGQANQTLSATGTFKFKKDQVLRFKPGVEVSLYPQLLKLFRPQDLNSIYIEPLKRDSALFSAIGALSGLTAIQVNRTTLTEAELACLNKLPHLRSCDLRYCGIDAAVLARQNFLNQIENLRFEGSKVVTPVVRQLSQFNKVDNLTLGACQLSDEDITSIASLANLQELSLLNTTITNNQLARLVVLQKIKRLNLDLCSKLDQSAIATLAQFKNLEVVTVPDALLTDSNETQLTNSLPKLKSFR